MERLTGLLGVVVLLLIAWGLSSDRRRVPWRVVLAGLGLQAGLAVLLLRAPVAVDVFDALVLGVSRVISAADAGISFVWGGVGEASGPVGFVFVARVSGIIIFFSSLMAVLYHVGVMPRVVAGMAWLLRRSLGITGVEALSAASNVFVGQTEAPFCVRPYIERMTSSQIMSLMTVGFATIAGSVLALYVGMLGGDDEATRLAFTKHLLVASVMSAPAGILIARVMLPETGEPEVERAVLHREGRAASVLDAATAGAADGLKLALNVVAMLIAFLSLVALVNMPLGWFGGLGFVGLPELSVEWILGWLFMPLAWLLGVSGADAAAVGSLLGQKVMLTELVAFGSLSEMVVAEEPAVSARSAAIAAYALCGFANVPSIGIQIGGLSALAPSRRADFVRLGPRAMVGGALASWLTAAVAGVLLPG